MTQRLSRIFFSHRGQCLRDEAHGRIPDRVGRGLEPRPMGRLQGFPKLGGGMDEHAAFFRPAFVRGIERGRERSEGSVGEDLDGYEAKTIVLKSGMACGLSMGSWCRARDQLID